MRTSCVVVAASFAVTWLLATPGGDAVRAADECASPIPVPLTARPRNNPAAVFDWNDGATETTVELRSRASCARLVGTLFTPSDMAGGERLPAVLVLPPSGGVATRTQVAYVARHLASNGYVALTVDPAGVGDSDVAGWPPCGTETGYSHPSPCPGVPFQRMDNWLDAGKSGLDFLLSPANPAWASVDVSRVGAAGHSLGARAASYLQDPRYDLGPGSSPRVHAVVGLDNLSSNYFADPSAASGGGVSNNVINGQPLGGDEPIAITAPGLGLSSDDDSAADPDTKKFAFLRWRDAGIASGMLVLEGVAHGEFSQQASSDEALLHTIAVYTRAWFDRHLVGDRTAVSTLLSRAPLGVDVQALLSDTQRSGWYLPKDGVHECDDWRSGCGQRAGAPARG